MDPWSDDKLRAAFSGIDTDGSGRICPKELQQLFKLGNHNVSIAICSLLIGLFDEGAGSIDFEGFSSLWNLFSMWHEIFKNYDKDNSGFLEKTELMTACQEAFEDRVFKEDYVEMLMRKFGDTKAGVLTADEYLVAFAYVKDSPPPKKLSLVDCLDK